VKSIHSVFDIADYFLCVADEMGSPISNRTLQEVVYLAQAWHLGIFKTPLFDEDFQAWDHGPVIPELYQLYREYKRFGYKPAVNRLSGAPNTENKKKLLQAVAEAYMREDGYASGYISEEHDPWLTARKTNTSDGSYHTIISKDSIRKYYEKKMEQAHAEARLSLNRIDGASQALEPADYIALCRD